MNRLLLSGCFWVVLTLSAADLGWPQPTVGPTDPALTVIAHSVSVKVPISLYWGYLVIVEGSIGNLQKLSLLVDTGAYPSVVDQKIAHALGLAEQDGRVNLSNTSVQTRLVVLPSLTVGSVRAESLPVLTQDLSFLQKAVGHKVDAIVGLDVLRKSSFAIDYRTREMLFGAIEKMAFSAPFTTEMPVVTIATKFQSQNLRLVVDTGSPDVMLFESRMQDTTGFEMLGTKKTVNVSGTFKLKKVRMPEVFLGQATIGTQEAFMVHDRKDDGDNFDGVLGMRGPQFQKIAFDFEHRRFSWELQAVASGITVAVFDDVNLPPRVLAGAEEEAARVYQKEGVPISWIGCKSSNVDAEADLRCQAPASPTRLNLRIIGHASKANAGVVGVAFLSAEGTGAYSDVSYDSVEKLEQEWHIGVARILGHVMAHELGHLLLGSNSHSQQGLMCPSWHKDELHRATTGSLLFSEEQARFMRERLAR